MPARHVVVDGSNIATEGRSLPSLAQLDEAVREYRKEFPDDVVTVVVDATFGHRIEESERVAFEEAVAHNELVSPPAGAIGRGDAFLLRVAEKVGGTVLSNDSFQEFHGEHDWLFHDGRLIGGKPVPDVGWVFTPRTPVRGPKSREAVRTARRALRKPKPAEDKKVQKAIAVATEEAVEPDSSTLKRRRRRRSGAPPAEPVNEPLHFIEFVAAHPLGSTVEAEVETFSSHGAFAMVGEARCYVPLTALADPPPRAAREVLTRGERRTFVVQALDPARRGVELALPELARVAGAPTPETVEDEIREGRASGGLVEAEEPASPPRRLTKKSAAGKAAKKAPDAKAAKRAPAAKAAKEAPATLAKKAPATEGGRAAKKTAAREAARKSSAPEAASKATVTKAAAKQAAKKAVAKKAATKKASVKQAAAKKVAVKKAAVKKAAVKKAVARKAAAGTAAAGTGPDERALASLPE